MAYISEFLAVVVVHFLAVIAPGPEFVMVVRYSIAHGREKALWLSLGIGLGTLLHVSYSLLGIGVLVSQSVQLFDIMKLLGASYLTYLGISALRAKPAGKAEIAHISQPRTSIVRTLWTGFLTSALNPKATLFFLALFTVVISPATPTAIKIGYGVWMSSVNSAWLATLAYICTRGPVQRTFREFGHWLERAMGALLIGLAVRLAVTRLR